MRTSSSCSPGLVGHGRTLLAWLSKHTDLRLMSRLEFDSKVVAMRYEPRTCHRPSWPNLAAALEFLLRGASSIQSAGAFAPCQAAAWYVRKWCYIGGVLPLGTVGHLRGISTPSSLHLSNRNLLISATTERVRTPDTLSNVNRDATAADASVEPSVFTASSAADVALRSSKVTTGVTITLTEKALPLAASLSSTSQIKVCSGRVMVPFASVIALTMRSRLRDTLTLH